MPQEIDNQERHFATSLVDCVVFGREGQAPTFAYLYAYTIREGDFLASGYYGCMEWVETGGRIAAPIVAGTPTEAADAWWEFASRGREVYAPTVDRPAFGSSDEGVSMRVATQAMQGSRHTARTHLPIYLREAA